MFAHLEEGRGAARRGRRLRRSRRRGDVGRRHREARHDAHAGRRGEGRQRRRHHPRLGRRHHQAGRRLQAGRAVPRPVPRRQAAVHDRRGKSADKYKDQLTPGQVAMLKKYPTYKMIVYPTRRSAAFPACHYNETKECAAKAKLAAGGNGVTGCVGGIPFPVPKDGFEAIWNSMLRYRGDTFAQNWAQAAVTRTGDYAHREVRVRVRLPVRQLRQARGAAREQQDPQLPAGHHGAGAPGGPDPAGARDGGPGEGAALGLDLQPRPAPRAPRAQRRLRQPRHGGRRPAHQRRLRHVQRRDRPLQLEASSARRRCTCRTTPTA